MFDITPYGINCYLAQSEGGLTLMLDSNTKQVAKPILCDTYTLIHINQCSLIAFLNNLKSDILKSDNIMTNRLTLMTSNINDTRVQCLSQKK